MTGSLAGFENDQFVHLSQAQQVVLGERPTRDFVELGMPLTVGLSAAAQVLGGRTLLSELALTTGFLALCSVLLFGLAYALTRSYGCALIVALLQVAMTPRFYNYPKLLAYALALPAICYYVDAPGRRRAWLLGAVGAAAFLLRHDHGAYVALGALTAIVLVHRSEEGRGFDLRRIVQHVGAAALAALICCAPYFVLLQASGDVGTHFRDFATFASRVRVQTDLKWPQFTIDWTGGLYEFAPPAPRRPGIHIRWRADLPTASRESAERQFSLSGGEPLGEDVWSYSLLAWAPPDLETIVRSPLVLDTQGISRTRFVITDPDFLRQPPALDRARDLLARLHVLPGILRAGNAVPFLYYLFVGLPLCAAALGWGGFGPRQPLSRQGVKLAVLVVVACAMSAGILRGNLASRLADVSQVVGVLAAWTAATVLASTRGGWRVLARVGLVIVAVCAFLSIDAIEGVRRKIVETGVGEGLAGMRDRLRPVLDGATSVPPVDAWPADTDGIERLARYVNRCTEASDRLLAVSYTPELYFMSARGFAGGHVWLQPGYFTAEADQRLMLTRLRQHRVPIVITAPEPTYTTEYADSFPILTAAIAADYRNLGEVDLGRDRRLGVFVRRDLTPTGIYAPMALPCFASQE